MGLPESRRRFPSLIIALNFAQARGEACCLRNFFAPSPHPPRKCRRRPAVDAGGVDRDGGAKLLPYDADALRIDIGAAREKRQGVSRVLNLLFADDAPASPSLSPHPRKSKRRAA